MEKYRKASYSIHTIDRVLHEQNYYSTYVANYSNNTGILYNVRTHIMNYIIYIYMSQRYKWFDSPSLLFYIFYTLLRINILW